MPTLRIAVLTAGLATLAPAARAQVDDTTMRAHFIDVGQGAAALLEFSCGVVMIDAGGLSDATTAGLVAYVRGVFAARPALRDTIATLFISHNHLDHTRGLQDVLAAFRVRRVIENGQRALNPADRGDAPLRWAAARARADAGFTLRDIDQYEVHQAPDGLADEDIDPLACAGTDPDIRLLSADQDSTVPWPRGERENKNNHSLVIRVSFGRASFLFTGDLQVPAIETLLETYGGGAGGPLDVDVYHAGHHGAENGTTVGLLYAIREPRLAIISMGPCDERGVGSAPGHGHPRERTVRLLRRAVGPRREPSRTVHVALGQRDFLRTTMRDAIYATGWDGSVIVTATAGGTYRVSTAGRPVPTC